MTNQPTALFVTGPAGAGKSFFARRVAMLTNVGVIDKDTMTMDLVGEMNKRLGIDENDRQSVLYQNFVRPFEYGVVMTEAVQRLESGKDVIVDAPFLNQIAKQGWMKNLRSTLNEQGFKVVVVWMEHDLEGTKLRLENRGYLRDEWKISNWKDYASKVEQVNVPYEEFDYVVTTDNLEKKVIEISDLLHKPYSFDHIQKV